MSRPTPKERRDLGRERRKAVSRSSHAAWVPAPDRADPVDLVVADNATRLPWLVPVRHGRMSASAFAFYRGTAGIMAADLARIRRIGLEAQLCGDAHLSNFGGYAAPDRRLVFDINDFDETLPGPWEWDVKRLAASFVLAARDRGFGDAVAGRLARSAVASYRTAMAGFAEARTLDVWYERIEIEQVLWDMAPPDLRKRSRKRLAAAHARDSLQAFAKLAEVVDGRARIRNDPPLVVRLDDLPAELVPLDSHQAVHAALTGYRDSLVADRQALYDRYEPVDLALKVVGVGSVGTRCWILLLQGRDGDDPLFLQVKEAGRSVLEAHLPRSRYRHSGRRVVEGQRLMQAASDIFIGWTTGPGGVPYYVRQLRDGKISVDMTRLSLEGLELYADFCGRTLARAHARSGDAVAISAYLGSGDAFDRALEEFAGAYADQAEADHTRFLAAIDDGRLPAEAG